MVPRGNSNSSTKYFIAICVFIFFLLLLASSPPPKPAQSTVIEPASAQEEPVTEENKTESDPSMATLLASSTFTDASVDTPNHMILGGELNHNWFSLNQGTFKAETALGRTDNYSVKCDVNATGNAVRSECDIYLSDFVTTDTFYVSVWNYMPADWELATTSNYDWYEHVNPIVLSDVASRYPRVVLHISHTSGNWTLTLKYYYRINDVKYSWAIRSAPWDINEILGTWTHFEWWIKRSVTQGAMKFWMNGALEVDFAPPENSDPTLNFQTKNGPNPYSTQWWTVPNKSYYNADATRNNSDHPMWMDDLYIYDDYPYTPVYSKAVTNNASLLRQNYKAVTNNASLSRLYYKAVTNQASLQAAVPTCAWGSPDAAMQEAFHRAGDVNWDGVIDDTDVSLIQAHYGERGTPGWIDEDVNHDGIVDVRDLLLAYSTNHDKNICDLNIQTAWVSHNASLQTPSFKAVSHNASLSKLYIKAVSNNASLEAPTEPTFSPLWDRILRAVGRVQTPNDITVGGMPEMRVGGPAIRVGVLTKHFEKIEKAVEKVKT